MRAYGSWAVGAGLAAAMLSAGAVSAQDVGGFFKNLFSPPAAPAEGGLPVDEAYCPQVDVAEGGAAVSVFGGGAAGQPSALRTQITLANFARECRLQPDGSVVVKVGVQGRVLLGPGGRPGSFPTSVQFALKVGDRVVTSRVQRVTATVPAGAAQGAFAVVQDGLVVPRQDAGEFEIEVRLGGSGPKKSPPRPTPSEG